LKKDGAEKTVYIVSAVKQRDPKCKGQKRTPNGCVFQEKGSSGVKRTFTRCCPDRRRGQGYANYLTKTSAQRYERAKKAEPRVYTLLRVDR